MSIRRGLVFGSIILIVVAFLVCTVGLYQTLYVPLVGDLTALEMNGASDRVALGIKGIFARVDAIATRDRDWAELAPLDLDDLYGLNKFIGPLFKTPVGVTSLAIASDTGHEVLFYGATAHGWFNRLTNPEVWGNQARILTWGEGAVLEGSEQHDVDYDARTRPWFLDAMSGSDDGVYWIGPYKFVSTEELGMSAVVHWTGADNHRYAMATDITLFDLTRFTREIGVGTSGFATVITDDGQILAVPRDPRFESDDAIKNALLKPVGTLGVAPLAAAFTAWQKSERPEGHLLKFQVGDVPWLATFASVHLGAQAFWIVTLVPAADFRGLTDNTLALGIALILATAAIASLFAAWLGSGIAGPIEQLTAESARIGGTAIDRPIAVRSAVHEIDTLARSLEKMRVDLVRARTELETKAELEKQLERAQRMESLGQLAGGIAHDFNNLLGSVIGFAEFLVQDLAQGTPTQHFARNILQAGERGKAMVQQIMAFSRNTGVERTAQNLVRVVNDTQSLLRSSLPSSTLLEIKLDASELIVSVNIGQVTQILFNLCINANDALNGEPGAIAIVLAAIAPGDSDYDSFGGTRVEEGWIAAGTLDPRRAYARILVADSGGGIAPAALRRIFEPFFTTKARGHGTGLGLAVVHGIVLDYGGACTVASHAGTGTVFTVYLPLVKAAVAAPVAIAPRPGRGRERIMVVDDEPDLGEVLTIALERLGYTVTAFTDAVAALTALTAHPDAWDLVVSDEVMPRIKGLALFARMKAIKPSLRFILCTGYSEGVSEDRVLAAGVDALFLKPVPSEQIAAAIRRVLDESAAVVATGGDSGAPVL